MIMQYLEKYTIHKRGFIMVAILLSKIFDLLDENLKDISDLLDDINTKIGGDET